MNVAFYTLGCKVNQYDTQIMSDRLKSAGYTVVPFSDYADVYIVNTCTVTQISDKKSRQIIHRVKRRAPRAILVVCGCFSQADPESAANIEGVNIVLGTSNRKNILQYLERFQQNHEKIIEIDNSGSLENEQIRSFNEKTRAIIKIEDGCDNFCSYCLIPYARGRVRSKPLSVLEKEAYDLASAGYTEIVLTGIHLASYGKDLGGPCLEKAISAVSRIDGITRIRLGSLEPRIITESFVESISAIKALCPHFHLSLQSGSDPILKAMNRHYTTEQFRNAVRLLRFSFPNCAVTTDLIVGFPGESEDYFEESIRFIREIGFAKIHIFPFSERKGTAAASMTGKISAETKALRVKKAELAEQECRVAFWKNMVGKKVCVLPEEYKNGFLHGFTENYIPIRWHGLIQKKPVELTVTGVCSEGLEAE